MNNKAIIIALFIVASGYSVIAAMTISISPDKNICTNKLMRFIAPWSSACFYTAYYQEDGEAHSDQLMIEKETLEKFVDQGGVAADILWYRSKLNQKHQLLFRTSFQDLHEMHNDYTRSDHFRIDKQADYLQFLQVNDLLPLAQETLDEFCKVYIPLHRDDLIEKFKSVLSDNNIPLSMERCNHR